MHFDFNRFLDYFDGGLNEVARDLELSVQEVEAWFQARRLKYYGGDCLDAEIFSLKDLFLWISKD